MNEQEEYDKIFRVLWKEDPERPKTGTPEYNEKAARLAPAAKKLVGTGYLKDKTYKKETY